QALFAECPADLIERRLTRTIAKTECARDGRDDVLRLGQRGEVHEASAPVEEAPRLAGYLQRQSRLAAAARSAERHETAVRACQLRGQIRELLDATHQWRWRPWDAKATRRGIVRDESIDARQALLASWNAASNRPGADRLATQGTENRRRH